MTSKSSHFFEVHGDVLTAGRSVAGQALHGPELAATAGPAVPTETLVGQILSAQPTDPPFVGSVVE